MTDRELLGKAAKSIGYELVWTGIAGDMPNPIYFDAEGTTTGQTWNPLTDDGDALRLAVKLEMDIMQRRSDPEVWVQAPMMRTVQVGFRPCPDDYEDGKTPSQTTESSIDRYAATRRAIVRAAAEIGSKT